MKKEKPEEPEKKENAAPEEANVGNYMAEGMCFGLALGLILGQAVFHNLALGMCMSLFIGLIGFIGIVIGADILEHIL